jgi:hypothetical protein
MPELREVFEMTTKQMEPDVDAWRDQETRQRKANRNKKVGAFAVAAVIAVAAVAFVLGTRGGQNATTPAGEPAAVSARAQGVATGFVEAFGAFDPDRAITYLADDADLGLMATTGASATGSEATGFGAGNSCAVNSTTVGTGVPVRLSRPPVG